MQTEDYDSRKAARMCHIEACSFDVEKTAQTGKQTGESCQVLFDYEHRNPLTMDARVMKIHPEA